MALLDAGSSSFFSSWGVGSGSGSSAGVGAKDDTLKRLEEQRKQQEQRDAQAKKVNIFGLQAIQDPTKVGVTPPVEGVQAPDALQAPQGVQGVHGLLDNAVQKNGENFAKSANSGMGNDLSKRGQRQVDSDAKPVTKEGFDKDGNLIAQNTDRVSGTVTQYTDKGDTKLVDVTDKNGINKGKGTLTKNADGSVLNTSVNHPDGTSTRIGTQKDKDGNLIKKVSVTTDSEGKKIKSSQTVPLPDGTFEVKNKDAAGKVVTEKTDENGRVLARKNPETGKFEEIKSDKPAHEKGSLGEIKERKKEVEKAQKEASKQKLMESDEKFKAREVKKQGVDAQIKTLADKPNKTKEEEKQLKSLQNESQSIGKKQAKVLAGQTKKDLADNGVYQDLKAEEFKEEVTVAQYKDTGYDLTKDGKALTAEEISDMKAQGKLFGADGAMLSKEELAAQGVGRSISVDTINNDPAKAFALAHKEGDTITMMMSMFKMQQGGGQAAMTPEQKAQADENAQWQRISQGLLATNNIVNGMRGGSYGSAPQQQQQSGSSAVFAPGTLASSRFK